MSEDEIRQYLEDNGYPAHAVAGGARYLVERYREFVCEVERGYAHGLHDYRHDLAIRAAIAVVGLGDEVAGEDERLARRLENTQVRVWESMPGDPFWDFGYPAHAGPRLIRDLSR